MKKSTFKLEKALMKEGYDFIIGIDEAGRGPLAGPVVAAATTARNFQFPNLNFQKNVKCQMSNVRMLDLIRDSKTLSEKQREKIYDFILENFYVGIGICDHKTIDRMNILQATFLAMKKSVADLKRIMNYESGIRNNKKKSMIHDSRFMILVDGSRKIPNFSLEQKAITSGDKLVKSISAASIIAKVTRDRIMRETHEKFPQYGFQKHKGYGTKLHMDRLKKHGPCKIHRKSFKPIKKLAKSEN